MALLPQQLQQYLYEQIPLSKAMQAYVVHVVDDALTLGAPLEPNINHRATAFGGSASTLAILAAWSHLHVRLAAAGMAPELVIQRNTMEYTKPITGAFTATASINNGSEWRRFLHVLARRGKARIRVTSVLACDGETVGKLAGDFVALQAADRTQSSAAPVRAAR